MRGVSIAMAVSAAAAAFFGSTIALPDEVGVGNATAVNSTDPPAQKDTVEAISSSFWYSNISHINSKTPDIDDTAGQYKVYREVKEGDGADAIQEAIRGSGYGNGKRHPMWMASQPRVVYFRPGEYFIDKTIYMNTDTVLMGDANNPPILSAMPGWTGEHILLSGQDPATGEKGENSFTVAVRNLVLNTTRVADIGGFTALSWGVAQGSYLSKVRIAMPHSDGTNGHIGIKLGRGSTLTVADVEIHRGQVGIWHAGHQQALYKNILFSDNSVAMKISGGDTITLLGPRFVRVQSGVQQESGDPWIGVIDASSTLSGITLQTNTHPSILVENHGEKGNNLDIVHGPNGFVLAADFAAPSREGRVNRFTYANTWASQSNPTYDHLEDDDGFMRNKVLAPDNHYLVQPAPTHAGQIADEFIDVKDPSRNGGYTVYGDGYHDDSQMLNLVLQRVAAQNKIAYFPFGKYRVEKTLIIPINSRIVGEAWATITGAGDYFKNAANPQPVVQCGAPGDVGFLTIEDMRFTVSEILSGAIILQFHAAGSQPGAVAIWNSLVTVGGLRSADGVTKGCRDPKAQCRAAFLGIHLTKTSSVYLENVWNWVADHVVEDIAGAGSSIAAGRGVLVKATQGTWLHGLGSEHWWLYQLNFRNAENVVITLLQSETNYDQGENNPRSMLPPTPWTADKAWGDPDFSSCNADDGKCRMGFASYINGGNEIYSYASASWTFFSGPGSQPCGQSSDGRIECQKYLHWIQGQPQTINLFGICSKDTYAPLRLATGEEVLTKNGFTGGWPSGGGDIGRYTPL